MPGRVLTHPAVARSRFREITFQSEAVLDLTEASLVIALEEYPALQIDHYLQQIDRWSDAIRERVDGSRDEERVVAEINRFLFEQEGFHEEADDYSDPRFAFLNEVIDRHAGTPITLSIVYIEICRRLGFPMTGVSFPGHFLVKLAGASGEILIDPAEDGRVLSAVECQKILDQLYGGGIQLREHHLRSVTKREILCRLLAHLKSVYMSRHDLVSAVSAVDRILLLDDRDPYELRDRGVLAMQTHAYREAIDFLTRYLEIAPHAEDRQNVRDQVDYLRAWLDQN